MRLENKRMQDCLRSHGILAVVKRLHDGSLKHTWRIYAKSIPWTVETAEHLNAIGLRDYDGKPFTAHSGNGGMFQVFARGFNHLASQSGKDEL